ncbi:RNA polymerase II elongation factor ELL2-like [Catharus ustulatus]|uniref:RNA polymerase II elongation factor ELL2-like n=1 Tax=Catharus ustulatus TaxID=91951 RepID=UPI00140CE23A|nr:RNA polymerase II elongation factor ELL2-like [Catharus ustulatus]
MFDHPYSKSAPSQNTTSSSQVPSPEPSERDAPARSAQKRPLAPDFTSPVKSKKSRTGHQQFTSHIQPAAGGLSSSWVLPSTSLFTGNMSPSVGSISPCIHEVHKKDNFQRSSIPEPARVQEEIPNSIGKKNELGRLKQAHPLDFDEGTRKDTSIVSTCSATTNQADYLRKYTAIVSLEQGQHYKDDFNAGYEEYRNLHAQIDKINKDFVQFYEQWKCLNPGSETYQGSPSYSEMKSRCQYLHKRLSHIQRQISEFDKQ